MSQNYYRVKFRSHFYPHSFLDSLILRNRPIDNIIMDRREAIKNVAILMGGALSATTVAAVISGFTPAELSGKLSFTASEEAVITELADIILPDTKESPGARVAGVGPFIPMMLKDCYPEYIQR